LVNYTGKYSTFGALDQLKKKIVLFVDTPMHVIEYRR